MIRKMKMSALLAAVVLCCAACGNNANVDNEKIDEWVDLGLPSGLLWATCNLGADSLEDIGSHYSWGDTMPETHKGTDYKLGVYILMDEDDDIKFTKYCCYAEYGLDGFVDSLMALEAVDDAATHKFGEGTRTPTKDDWGELISNTTAKAQDNGLLLTGPNGNTLFLPVERFYVGSGMYDEDDNELWAEYHVPYMTATLNGMTPVCIGIQSGEEGLVFERDDDSAVAVRSTCQLVRPVREK